MSTKMGVINMMKGLENYDSNDFPEVDDIGVCLLYAPSYAQVKVIDEDYDLKSQDQDRLDQVLAQANIDELSIFMDYDSV